MSISRSFPRRLHGAIRTRFQRALLQAGAAAMLIGLAPAAGWLPGAAGQALAASATAARSFTLSGVRPEALSWYWDNVDAAIFMSADPGHRAFAWIEPPSSPQHLGYSAGARYRATQFFGGATHSVEVRYLDPQQMRMRVASDNYLGAKPYSFVAQSVSIDGRTPFTVLIQYLPTGSGFNDSAVSIEAGLAVDAALAQAYVDHVMAGLKGLGTKLTTLLNDRYFNGVLKTRGAYKVGPIDSKLNVTLTVEQEIHGITADMLAWWWDHIGNTARYRLWQPIDHVSFDWTVPPSDPDMHYDIGAVQKVKEYIGKSALTLSITGADPAASPPPPVPVVDPGLFYARADLTLLKGILPSNALVHQWRPNATGDGVVLTSTFVNTALARILNPSFFEDLGSHALREFQMLPYFLPRLYRREQLGE